MDYYIKIKDDILYASVNDRPGVKLKIIQKDEFVLMNGKMIFKRKSDGSVSRFFFYNEKLSEIMFDKTFLGEITAADVSSQLVSIPRMNLYLSCMSYQFQFERCF